MDTPDKKLEKLQKLFEIANEDFATPEDVIKMSEMLLQTLSKNKAELEAKIAETQGKSDKSTQDSLKTINQTEARLTSLIATLKNDTSKDLDTATTQLSKEIKRVEKKIPTKTDLSGLEKEIQSIKDSFNTLPTELTINNEAIRDGLELLEGEERLDKSAIKGLDDYDELINLAKSSKDKVIAGVRFFRYLADVNIEGITDGQPIVWDETTGRFMPGPGGSGSGVVETIVAGTGITVDDTDPANPVVSATASAPAWGAITGTLSDQTDLQTALDAKQAEAVVVSGNLTASLDQYYNNVASATYTDPTPTEGKGFIVFVRNGTATVGGTGYSTAGTVVRRIYHSGAWANYVYQVSSTFALASHTHTASEVTDFDTEVSNNTDVAANTAARHVAATVTDSTSIDLMITGQDITAQREALTGAITAPKNSNTTSLGSFTVSQLNTALSDGDVATGGGTATGTNTGDQTSIVGITGTKAQFDTAVTDGNFLYVGDVTQYTDELAQDAIGNAVGNGLDYDDGTGAISVDETELTATSLSGFTEGAQDAVGAMVDTTLVYSDATPSLGRAALTGAITASAGSNATSLGSFTKSQLDGAVSDGNVLYVGDVTSNATHTGEVTGATTLTIDKTAITNRTGVSAATGDYVLISDVSDTDNLKKVTVQSIVDLAGGSGNTFNDIYIDQSGGTSDTYGVLTGTINGSNALFTVSQSVYATGTLKVWLNGQLMTQGSSEDFVETTPASGTFTFNTAPASGSLITVEYQKVVTNSDTIVTTSTIDELAQDAVGTILTDSSEIDFTYNDGVPSITASIVSSSIDETKLDASVNASLDLADSAAQNSFRTIAVSGQSDVVADSATDTLTLVAGTNVTITTDAGTDTVTINASGGAGGGLTLGLVLAQAQNVLLI